MDPTNVKTALDAVSTLLSSLAGEVAFLKAERWALEEAMKDSPPEFFSKIASFRRQDTYHNIRSGYALVASNVQEAVNKSLL